MASLIYRNGGLIDAVAANDLCIKATPKPMDITLTIRVRICR